MKRPDLSIVIPVYNSGDWLESLVERIERTLDGIGRTPEIILVNDASPNENMWPVISLICSRHSAVVGINLLFNRGQFLATMCGLEHSTGILVATMDDDLQHPPEELPQLIQCIEQNRLDAVFGVFAVVKQNLFRRMGSRFTNALYDRVYRRPKGQKSSSFRIMRRDIAEAVVLYKSAYPHISPIIFSITRKVGNQLVEHHSRPFGKSNYTTKHLIAETVELVVNGSTIPLDVVGYLGLMASGLSFLLGLYFFTMYLLGRASVPGFTALVLIAVFFFGVLLLGMAVLGKYLTRIVRELTGLPRYVVKDLLRGAKIE